MSDPTNNAVCVECGREHWVSLMDRARYRYYGRPVYEMPSANGGPWRSMFCGECFPIEWTLITDAPESPNPQKYGNI